MSGTPPPVVVPLLKMSPEAKAAILARSTPPATGGSAGSLVKQLSNAIDQAVADGETGAAIAAKVLQLLGF
jgi:hypothetical protein